MPLHKTTPEEIIKQSINVFRTNGYYRTTMNDLAKATGLTKGAFYHHFKSKEEVMQKSLQATSFWFDRKVFAIAYDEALPKKERLKNMVDVLYEAFTKSNGGCFFANTILETAHVEDTFLAEINQFFKMFENALSSVFNDKYSEKEMIEITYEIIADIEGSIIIMQLKKDPKILRKALNRVKDRL
ncbi:TetR/AcrR family transcriptional regulator [Aquiflexum lacus]|uniref:TetR/AcrR family transcriptional regulator n=1 Tax=Aquiflexum lacus TaxID=2483805 RepID=UPI0018963925|nr:TetR/AcrR family transcriptional regulator [Aquiflexum lacus]